MKRPISIFILFLFCFLNLQAQEYYTDEHKEFSFELPENWITTPYNGLKYKIAVGDVVNNFTQNIVITSENFDGNMEQYIFASIVDLKKTHPNTKFLKNEKFEIENISAWKTVILNTYGTVDDREVRQYLYVLKNEKTYYIFTASVLAESPEEMEEMFDACARTIKFFPKSKSKPADKEVQTDENAETKNSETE